MIPVDRPREAGNFTLHGIEYLRALMSVFVVVWHMGGAGHSLMFSRDQFAAHRFSPSDFVDFHVLLLAVPVFVLVSNYLLASRSPDRGYVQRRIGRLFLLLSFWSAFHIVFFFGYEGLLRAFPKTLGELFLFIIKGGNTIFYFFFCLVGTSLVTYGALRLKRFLLASGFVVSVLILFLTPLVAKIFQVPELSAFWNPLNFLPYPFAAVMLARTNTASAGTRGIAGAIFLAAGACFAFVEWSVLPDVLFFATENYGMPAYTRPSCLFLSMAVLVLALNPGTKGNGIVRFMGSRSLALYCLHPISIGLLSGFISLSAEQAPALLHVLAVIVLSYAISLLLTFYLKKDLLR